MGKILEAVVAKDFNHPSVLMYSIGNEIFENCTRIGAVWNRKLANKIRSLDSARYVTNGVNPLINTFDELEGDINDAMTALQGAANDVVASASVRACIRQSSDSLDLLGLNYARGAYEPELKENPNQILFGSETYPPDIDLNWKLVKKYPALIGDFTWTGWDYIGEAGVGYEKHDENPSFFAKWPVYLAYCGDLNLIGDRRPMSYFREIVFGLRDKPYIAVQNPAFYEVQKHVTPWATEDSRSSWTWNGWEEKPCIVEVFSDAEEVELFCNGKSLGRKEAGEKARYRTQYITEYIPGTLEAAAYYQDERPDAFYRLETAGEAVRIDVEADRTLLQADGQDLAFITVSLKDKNGILNDWERKTITVTVEGAGVLQGMGTGDPCSETSFQVNTHQTFEGRLLAVVRACAVGEIRVVCNCEGMPTKELLLTVR
ncbi:MAG: DUF4982 domain-containing protein [Eubacteriales bacterium]|nr:DUF4982 domain-containing protein [Eubacteriales bacterium]